MLRRIEEVPEDVLEAALRLRLSIMRESSRAGQVDRKDRQKLLDPMPKRGRHGRLVAGRRRSNRPQSAVGDLKWVPGALRQWRQVHGLSAAQAQVKAGYSPRSSTWRDWEAGRTAPPYLALVKILASTGLIGAGDRAILESSPSVLLEVARASHQSAVRRRRAARGR